MSGYPNKILRDSIGPTFEDETKITNPKKELGAGTVNLMAWQVAGMNGPAPRVFMWCSYNGTLINVDYQWMAWDPNQQYPKAQWTRSAQGVYTWTLTDMGLGLGIYPDKDGVATPVSLLAALPIIQGTLNIFGIAAVNANGYSGTCNIYVEGSGAGGADPSKFGLVLF